MPDKLPALSVLQSMIIKKFTAETETEAILMAKEEMGPQAVVLNIKKKSADYRLAS